MWAMAALVVGITSISCDRDRKPIQLPPLAEGPFEPRLKEGWRVHSVSYEGTMPNPFDTTTTAQFNGEARFATCTIFRLHSSHLIFLIRLFSFLSLSLFLLLP